MWALLLSKVQLFWEGRNLPQGFDVTFAKFFMAFSEKLNFKNCRQHHAIPAQMFHIYRLNRAENTKFNANLTVQAVWSTFGSDNFLKWAEKFTTRMWSVMVELKKNSILAKFIIIYFFIIIIILQKIVKSQLHIAKPLKF